MSTKTLKDLFVHSLSDIYRADKQMTNSLPRMARASTTPGLGSAFEQHLEETQGQIERIDQIVETTGISLKRIRCVAMGGLVEEGQEQTETQPGCLAFLGRICAEKRVDPSHRDRRARRSATEDCGEGGEGRRRVLLDSIQPLLSQPHVEMVGEIDDAQKSGSFSGTRALLFPIGRSEPFGLVMIEAMAWHAVHCVQSRLSTGSDCRRRDGLYRR